MRIGIVGSIVESIPPEKYGGTERVIYHLVEGLVKRGHRVTLFCSGDSKTSARQISVTDKALRKISNTKDIYGFNTHAMLNIGLAYSMQDQFDVIHDHNPNMSMPTANIARIPVVQTWHGPFDDNVLPLFKILTNPYLVSISNSQRKNAKGVEFLQTVYNGLEMSHYPFGDQPQDYLLFCGRIDEEKGPHIAIDAAVNLGKKLIIAAKVDLSVPHIKKYYDEEIVPRLEKYGSLIEYVGEVDEQQRNELMKNALCLLHPITWPEPFGLALIEAMACGCPVIANNLGSMQEVIKDGKTGYIVNSFEEMLAAVNKISKIRRIDCRNHALNTFSADRMVDGYLAAYEKAIKLHTIKFGGQTHGSERQKRHRLFLEFSAGNN